MTMPWGRYRGHPVETLPAGYIVWALETATLTDDLAEALRGELLARFGAPPRSMRALPAPEIADAAGELIHAGYRALARRAHPDTGGSHEAMLAVQAAREWLDTVLRQGIAT